MLIALYSRHKHVMPCRRTRLVALDGKFALKVSGTVGDKF